MVELTLGDQTIRYDRGATVAVYESMQHGDAESCGCASCRNFALQRDSAYPPSFRVLLEQLGIDANKEGEAFVYGNVGDGRHLYGGWFYFVGELLVPGESNNRAPSRKDAAHDFHFFFTTSHPGHSAFRDGPMLAVEFTTHVKWVLAEPSPF